MPVCVYFFYIGYYRNSSTYNRGIEVLQTNFGETLFCLFFFKAHCPGTQSHSLEWIQYIHTKQVDSPEDVLQVIITYGSSKGINQLGRNGFPGFVSHVDWLILIVCSLM